MSEPDNLVLVLLREMRADMAAQFDAVDVRFDKVERKLEMMHANGDKALRQFIGHRAMVERSMASFDIEMREVKRRLELLETAQS